MDLLQAVATRRLQQDLKDVLANPLPDVVAQPLEDDLFVWHGNVRSSEGAMHGQPIHFILAFPHTYPAEPPEVRLFQAVPHANLRQAEAVDTGNGARRLPRSARWRLSLWDCLPGHSTWVCSYGVQSILAQLQVFLLDEDLTYDESHATAEQAAASARDFSCPHCSHGPHAAYPAIPTPLVMEAARRGCAQWVIEAPPVVPARSRPALQLLEKLHQKVEQQRSHQMQQGQRQTQVQRNSTAAAGTTGMPSPSSPPAKDAIEDDGWQVVGGKNIKSKLGGKGRSSSSSTGGASTSINVPTCVQAPAVVVAAAPATASSYAGLKAGNTAAGGSLSIGGGSVFAVLATGQGRKITSANGSMVVSTPVSQGSGKAGKKNAKRALKRKQHQGAVAGSSSGGDGGGGGSSCGSSSGSPAGAMAAATSTAAPSPAVTHKPASESHSAANSSDGPSSNPLPEGQQADGDDGWSKVEARKQALSGPPRLSPEALTAQMLSSLRALAERPHSDIIAAVRRECRQLLSKGARRGSTSGIDGPHSHSEESVPDSWEDMALPTAAGWKADAAGAQWEQGGEEWDEEHELVSRQQAGDMGAFSVLPRDALLAVLVQLKPPELAHLSTTCRALHAACSDGALWHMLLRAQLPGAQVAASKASAWRHAYILESNHILEELRCYATRSSFLDDVLGLPLAYTTNPRTGAVDYIEAFPDLLSLSAFKAGMRATPAGPSERVEALLPLYITADHFKSALPHMPALLAKLAPERVGPDGSPPSPDAWLDVISKVLNTAVVLLCDQGVSISQRALQVYCSVHRLLLALAEHYRLFEVAAERLSVFEASHAGRTKAACPNLGLLFPLLSLSPGHTWQRMGQAIMMEQLDRMVLWVCKADPTLEQHYNRPPIMGRGAQPDEKLLAGSFSGARVALRLTLFHVAFLQLVAAPPGARIQDVMDGADAFYGRPPASLGGRLQRAAKVIVEVDSWPKALALAGLPPVDGVAMTNILRGTWARSCAKRYTRAGMDYSLVQRSGVSRLLLKGQSYNTPPNMSKVSLEGQWRWRPNDGMHYLDSSILIMGEGRRMLESVHYCHRQSTVTREQGAVTHSGDIIDFGHQQGTQLINVDLGGLGDHVHELIIVLSCWTQKPLSCIQQPMVEVADPATSTTLCSYMVGDLSREQMGTHSSVIMCCLGRRQAVLGGGWQVKAMGVPSHGDADNLGSVLRELEDRE